MPLSDTQVVAAFGDPRPYMLADGSISRAWEQLILDHIRMPAPLPASWSPALAITVLRVHRLVAEPMRGALEAIYNDPPAWASLGDCGGCYAFRLRRGSKKPSRHSWGIAIDIDVHDNPDHSAGKMHPGVIAAFRAHGFEWGGAWRTAERDPMHFEFSDLARLAGRDA